MLGSWGICEWPYYSGGGYLKVKDGKAVFTPTLPEFRAGLEYWHKFAAEGLLDVEGFTQTGQQFNALLKEGSVFSFFGWTPGTSMGDELASQYITVPIMHASDFPEIAPVIRGRKDWCFVDNYGFVITNACKDPKKLVSWYDAQNANQELKIQWLMGEEGKTWRKDENGLICNVYSESTIDFSRENMLYTEGCWGSCPVLILPEDLPLNGEDAPASAFERSAMIAIVQEDFPDEVFPVRNVPSEKVEERTMIETDLMAYLSSFVADSVVNGLDDAKWQNHMKTVEQYNASEWIQWHQDYLDKKF